MSSVPHPRKRRTHGVYSSADEALEAGHNLLRMLNGMPFGYQMGVFERLGAFPLVSWPRGEA